MEGALIGKPWDQPTINLATGEFTKDYQPLSDWRATAEYRLKAAQNLLLRFYLEHSDQGQPVRLKRQIGSEEVAA